MNPTLRERVADRLAELGRNPFAAAKQGGLERSFINDILNGKKTSVRGANLGKLALALDWRPEDILGAATRSAVPISDGLSDLYTDRLADSDYIQVAVGDLRSAALYALRRGNVDEDQAEALSHVLVEVLATRANVSIVVRLAERARSNVEYAKPKLVDPT